MDQYLLPSDSKVFGECLETLEVTRFEINDPKGSPRSFSIKFGFGENEYFEDKVLEKKFWFRKSLDGWQGLVSEPVKVNWKKDNDLSGGLTDAAYKLWQAKQKAGGDAKKATELHEYKELAEKIEMSEEPQPSFFAWFGFVSSYKWVSAAESEQAEKKEAEALEKKRKGEKVEEEEDEEDDGVDSQETEVFPVGDQLATIIAEDMWPSAVKYYSKFHSFEHVRSYHAKSVCTVRAHEDEGDDDDLSELEVEELDDDDSDEEIDIEELVGKGKKRAAEDSPASNKKQRKA